jgi:hypothetical protein
VDPNVIKMNAAKKFASDNIVILCVELKQWHDTAILTDGKLRELAGMLPDAISHQLSIAQSLVECAALEYVIRHG